MSGHTDTAEAAMVAVAALVAENQRFLKESNLDRRLEVAEKKLDALERVLSAGTPSEDT